MMKHLTNLLSLLLLFTYSFAYGQMDDYSYKRELNGVSAQWHKIIFPDDIYGKISQDLTDIRIFGVTAEGDTVETPYLLRTTNGKTSISDVSFKILNVSRSASGYYFTFEIPTTEQINLIKLDFKQENFDWRIKLEGSQNQKDWFTVIENYRILSIKNEITDFKFTKLVFPDSKYRFFRLFIDSQEKPELTSASITQNEITEGTPRNFAIRKFSKREIRESRQTEIDIELQMPVRVTQLKLAVNDPFDYYRPITIQFLSDSMKTERGWTYNYSNLTSGTLNSLEENVFKFNSTTVNKIKILIDNQDNQPLTIDSVQVTGFITELIARFTEKATFYLTYGNNKATKPNYDISHFADKVPVTLIDLKPGDEMKIEKENVNETFPLFNNMIWLWSLMGLIIVVLGWFSIKMLRKE
ncbi:MAG: DUF3999 family protein [Bacteroidetes bacterium]|nr:DUF3999 family protein [Bacteroidota bacterium]